LTPNPNDFAKTAKALIEAIQNSANIPREKYADHMDVQVNEKLAKRYNLNLKTRSDNDEL
tara:strand:- start:431 stop:610 length:180 start_codon:yes stop_codon:yes gene_type:complete